MIWRKTSQFDCVKRTEANHKEDGFGYKTQLTKVDMVSEAGG